MAANVVEPDRTGEWGMSVITPALVKKAYSAANYNRARGGLGPDNIEAALNAVLPDLLEEAMKVARRHADRFDDDTGHNPYRDGYGDGAEAVYEGIRALAEDTGTVQEKGR